MQSKIIILVGILFISTIVLAQRSRNVDSKSYVKKNIIDFAFGGSGQVLSLNYSRTLLTKPSYFVNGLIGVGTTFFTEIQGVTDNEGGTTIPHQLSFNYGKKKHFLELGLTGVYWLENIAEGSSRKPENEYYLSPLVGYRFVYKRMVMKAQYTPFVSLGSDYKPDEHFTSRLGISLGYGF